MTKIIDAFLFFQELDLLDIRLEYLDPYVDIFVIVEACQTFSGKSKPFNFERHKKRYSRYAHKINYFKIEDYHENFESVKSFLNAKNTPSHSKILQFLLEHKHYPKSEIRWVLDAYHRECIHLALDVSANDDDIVILSDMDEIPSEKLFSDGTLSILGSRPRVCRQHEFRYYLNFYKDSNWLGTIFSIYSTIKRRSLNELRIDSKAARSFVHQDAIENGGYHFTSCGNVQAIAEKIKSWAHQEFNNSAVLRNLDRNIRTGQDIFEREQGTNLTKISIDDERFFDKNLATILRGHPDMVCEVEISVVRPNLLYGFLRRVGYFIRRVIYKLSTMVRKA
jgi:beta-1,4-mannosyl-glycoprotein beta-1,4-N-acetylglucosaminyltransferase